MRPVGNNYTFRNPDNYLNKCIYRGKVLARLLDLLDACERADQKAEVNNVINKLVKVDLTTNKIYEFEV